MDLKKALELRMEYAGIAGAVKVEDGYVCLNDLNAFFPGKRLDHWLSNGQTQELINAVNKRIQIPGKSGIWAKRGNRGGTYAHHLVALDFAAWLSVEFRLQVYEAYTNGTQHKQDWNIKRIMAANGYKLMCNAIAADHEDPKAYHYSNEALMLNELVFGVREAHVRDTATEAQLDDIAWLESRNGAYIELGMDYATRKETLKRMYAKKDVKCLI